MMRTFLIVALLSTLAAAAPAAAGDVEAGRRKAERCAACHGADGNSTLSGTPSLAGMGAFYTHWQLIMFRDGRRRDSQMTPFVQNLTDEDLGDLSAYYRSEEHTSELQSQSNLVCRLLLEKKKNRRRRTA